MGRKFRLKRLLLLTLVFLSMGNLVYGQEEVEIKQVEARVRIKKYSGERLDIPTPEEREELNLLLSIEEREPVSGGVIQILNKEDELIADDISIDDSGIGEIDLPIGEYKLVDKIVPKGYEKEVYEFKVKEKHVDNGLVLESYNEKVKEEVIIESEDKIKDKEVIEVNTKDINIEEDSNNQDNQLESKQMLGKVEEKTESKIEDNERIIEKRIEDNKLPATGNSMDSVIVGVMTLVIGFYIRLNFKEVR